MKVDGSGEIRIGEGKAELLEVLNRHGIPVQSLAGDILAGDTMFYLDNCDSISRVQFFYQIDSGLKAGDTVSKMKQIYGVNYIAVKNQFNRGYFAYPMGNNTTLYIEAQGTSDESVIVDIEVTYPGFYGEAHQ